MEGRLEWMRRKTGQGNQREEVTLQRGHKHAPLGSHQSEPDSQEDPGEREGAAETLNSDCEMEEGHPAH